MFEEDQHIPDPLPRDRSRPRGRRIFPFLFAVSILALIPLEWLQGILRYDGRSMLTKTFYNESDQFDTSGNSTVTTVTPRPSSPTSTRNMTGTWIGNTWIPPKGWKYHSPSELRHIYSGKRVLWVGDSTGRRAAMNLYALLEWKNSKFLHAEMSSPKLIDVAKLGPHECDKWLETEYRPRICRAVNSTIEQGIQGEHIYSKAVCHTDVERFFQAEIEGRANITKDIDVIIVSIGIWDVIKPFACKAGLKNRTLAQLTSDVIELTNEFQIASGRSVIWRTSGYSEQQKSIIDKTSTLNKMTMDKIDQIRANNTLQGLPNRFSYVNWGGAVLSRSRPGERIQGDMHPHYGLEPRHVLIEMVTNHVEDEGYFINTSSWS